MAKILYGIMGNTHGHVMRTTAIVSRMTGHEFCFVGGGKVPEAMGERGRVLEVPVLRTVHRRQRVDVPATIGQIVSRAVETPAICKSIRRVMDEFQPDLAICDREFFLPIACQQAGLRCLSLDHSHVMKACDYVVPHEELVSWSLAMVNDYLFFDFTRESLVVSFFHPQLRPGRTDELLPPVLRAAVSGITPTNGDYILVYQTSATFTALIEALRGFRRRVVVYGFSKEDRTEGNIDFRAFNPTRILEDLAGCSHAVVNGGHNLICEALHFGKPLLCFPIATLFEQFINAWHVRELGFGDFSQTRQPTQELFEQFETRLEKYRGEIARHSFNGTARVVARLEEIFKPYG